MMAADCLILDIPDSVWAECSKVDSGHRMELYGTCVKKDQTHDENINKELFTIFAAKTDTSVVFSLHSEYMGMVFQEKFSGIWSCKVKSTCTHTHSASEQHEGIVCDRNITLDSAPVSESSRLALQSKQIIPKMVKHETAQRFLSGEHNLWKSSSLSNKFPIASPTVSTDNNPVKHEVDNEQVEGSTVGATHSQPQKVSADCCTIPGTSTNSTVVNEDTKMVNLSSDEEDSFHDDDSKDNIDETCNQMDIESGSELDIYEGNDERPYACDKCDKRFQTKYLLNRHGQIHDLDKPLQCPICDQKFNLQFQLDCHIRTHTGETVNLTCTVCKKSFKKKGSLDTHMRTHTGEKPYRCDTCGKSFVSSSHLAVHNRLHTGEKPFMCAICGKTFRQQSNHISHMRVHRGEKPFKCSVCGKAYGNDSNRKDHEMSHREEKSFICATCGKAFRQHSLLSRHMQVHSESRPYSCQTCGKSFLRNANLKVHLRQHTDEKPYSCDVCGKSFKQNVLLKRHFKLDHGQIDQNNVAFDVLGQ